MHFCLKHITYQHHGNDNTNVWEPSIYHGFRDDLYFFKIKKNICQKEKSWHRNVESKLSGYKKNKKNNLKQA